MNIESERLEVERRQYHERLRAERTEQERRSVAERRRREEPSTTRRGGPCATSVALAVRLPDRCGELKARARAVPPAEDDSYQLPEPLIEVLRALQRLSPNQREAVILHDYADPGTRL